MSGADNQWQRAYIAAVAERLGLSSAIALADFLAPVLDPDAVETLRQSGITSEAERREIPHEHRRRHGVFFTPEVLADEIAGRAVDDTQSGIIADISCGDGALLAAVAGRSPAVRLFGVDRELAFAVAAAARLVALREGQGIEAADRIVWGDGLAARPAMVGRAVAVVGNPPYVGEKGNRKLFADVRREHPELERFFGPRIDLHYLFLHRALDLLQPGGRLVYLTSEYWLTATGADLLRRDLTTRAVPTAFDALGSGAFEEAPGHHSLIFEARRSPSGAAHAAGCPPDGAPWHPFAEIERADGILLGDVASDRQGFVSGADRVTRRHLSHIDAEVGSPVFLYRAAEVPKADRDLFRPLIRRSDCRPNTVFEEAPALDWVLWSDGTEDDETRQRLQAILEPFRPLLERRREARTGAMEWHRIWWPRTVEDYAQPKLVVPRRAKQPAFCLDLSGSHVSSDCTFLLAPPAVEPVPWLLAIMLAANSPEAAAQLRAFGKTKGEILEFYSQPLKDWALPLRFDGSGRLVPTDETLRTEFEKLLAAHA